MNRGVGAHRAQHGRRRSGCARVGRATESRQDEVVLVWRHTGVAETDRDDVISPDEVFLSSVATPWTVCEAGGGVQDHPGSRQADLAWIGR